MITITTQIELDNILSSIYWGDAFIKEAHLFSPSYIVDGGGIVAYDFYPNASILVCTSETKCQGIEFILTEIDNFNLAFGADLSPRGLFFKTYVEFSFHECDKVMRAKQFAYRFLSGCCCEDKSMYLTP